MFRRNHIRNDESCIELRPHELSVSWADPALTERLRQKTADAYRWMETNPIALSNRGTFIVSVFTRWRAQLVDRVRQEEWPDELIEEIAPVPPMLQVVQ